MSIMAMAYNFRACDRDQAFLLPPDVRDWLPANHLAWFVLDVVDQLDLGPFLKAFYRSDGRRRAAYRAECCWPCCCTPTAPGSAPPARSSAAAPKTSPSGSWPATARLIT